MSYRKATIEEKRKYREQKPRPVYPLAGFLKVGGVELIVEDLREWPIDNPQYEILAPKGKHFLPDVLHSLLCDNLRDVRERIAFVDIADCDCE